MTYLKRLYLLLIDTGRALQSTFLLIVRLFWGGSFFFTGMGKLMNIDPVIGYFTSLNIPAPAVSAYLASYIEVVGGTCLFFGIASRIVVLPLIGNMIVAYLTAEIQATLMIFQNPINFVTRTPFTFLWASLTVFIFGPGTFSIDYLLGKYFFKKSSNGSMK